MSLLNEVNGNLKNFNEAVNIVFTLAIGDYVVNVAVSSDSGFRERLYLASLIAQRMAKGDEAAKGKPLKPLKPVNLKYTYDPNRDELKGHGETLRIKTEGSQSAENIKKSKVVIEKGKNFLGLR